MLLLTRKLHENIMIGDDIVVTVLKINPNQVQLGITAPKNVPVHRDEIYYRIKEQEKNDNQ